MMKAFKYEIFYKVQMEHWWFVARKKIMTDLLQRYAKAKEGGLKILDAGCGCGVMLNDLSKLGNVYGMDCDDDALAFSQKIFDGPVTKGSLAGNMPRDYTDFDLVLALDVLEHVEKDEWAISDMYNALANDGTALITVPAYAGLWSKHDDDNSHRRRYTKKTLAEKLRKSGFAIERISYYNFLLFVPAAVIRILYRKNEDVLRHHDKKPNGLINATLMWFFSLEKYLLRWLNLPFGLSIVAVARKTAKKP